jgi:CDP-paratose 2-epimerase
MNVLITGGGGFVGSHAAEYFAQKGWKIRVFDNLSRGEILGKKINSEFNWNLLKKNLPQIEFVKGDIRKSEDLEKAVSGIDIIIHTAAQVAVTTSVENPRIDFEINGLGTFNVLEAARKEGTKPALVYCSTNKVYGDNVNKLEVTEQDKRYVFSNEDYKNGIPEEFSTDLCEHTPYGCSKFMGDVYVQDYSKRGIVDGGIFRMSCIYGTRQMGSEDQGWIAHFAISTLLGKPLTIFGDGKQVRDTLYVKDLVKAYDLFIEKSSQYSGEVFNTGGGVGNTLSLLELLEVLEELTGKKSELSYGDWRPSDQKVYISDIRKAKKILGWSPQVSPKEGVGKLVNWIQENISLFK